MYELLFAKNFEQSYKEIIKGNKQNEHKFKKAISFLQQDPFYPSLKTHRINTKSYGRKWSSWVTGDLRIIWDFDEEKKLTILILTLGSHSGSHKVYT